MLYIAPADVYARTPTRTPRIHRVVFVIVMPREDIAFPVRFSKVTHGHPTRAADSSAALVRLARTHIDSECTDVLVRARFTCSRSPARVNIS